MEVLNNLQEENSNSLADERIIHKIETQSNKSCLVVQQSSLTHLKTIGRGRFAKVIHVKHNESGKEFAAKLQRLRRLGAVGTDMATIIETELKILQLVRGRTSFVQLLGYSKSPRESILLLEYCRGGSLQDIQQDLDQDFIKNVSSQLFSALSFLHEHSITHLDVKPANLILRSPFPTSDVCLCDFGLSRNLNSEVKTDVVTLNGTPDYCAPEILSFEPITTACDLWSAGAVLFFLIAGVSPFAPGVHEAKELVFGKVATVDCDWSLLEQNNLAPIGQSLIKNLLVKEPTNRLTASEALVHPFLALS